MTCHVGNDLALPSGPLLPGYFHNPVDTCIVNEQIPEGEAEGW
jgi:hypothetical protein